MSFPVTNEHHETPRLTPAVQAVMAINIVVMFVQITVVNYADMASWLGFDTASLPGRWWSAFTYMFVHAGVWHLVANLYALYLFGPRVEHSWGYRRFTWFYLVCGLGGAAFDMLFLRTGGLVGASAGVFGVMTAYAMQWPDEEVYLMFVLPMRVRTLVVALLAFNMVLGLLGTGVSPTDTSNVAYFAHLGGIIAAYLYVRMATSSAWTTCDRKSRTFRTLTSRRAPFRATCRGASAATRSTTSSRRARRSRQNESQPSRQRRDVVNRSRMR